MTILEKLAMKDNFTETEKRIADYILTNQSEMPNTTIQYIAKKVYSSHSSVIRLAKKLGFSGYKDFRVALIQEIQDNLHTSSTVNPNFPFEPYDDYFDIAKKMADLSIDSIQKTINKLDRTNLKMVSKSLIQADRIFLFGFGDSQIRAKSFQNKVNKINRYLILADEYGEGSWNSLNMTQNDSAIFISYGGGSAELKSNLLYAHQNGIDTILITSNMDSQIARISKYVIEVPQGELQHVKVGAFVSQISFEYILDTLFAILFSEDYTGHLVEMKRKQDFLRQKYENN